MKTSSRICRFCGATMETKHVFSRHCNEIDEDIVIRNISFDECPICHSQNVDIRIPLDLYHRCLERKISGWLFEKVKSFNDISKWFVRKDHAIKSVLRHAKKDGRKNIPNEKDHLEKQLKSNCFWTRICGEEFFLKSSINKYCASDAKSGIWPLKEGHHDEWRNPTAFNGKIASK